MNGFPLRFSSNATLRFTTVLLFVAAVFRGAETAADDLKLRSDASRHVVVPTEVVAKVVRDDAHGAAIVTAAKDLEVAVFEDEHGRAQVTASLVYVRIKVDQATLAGNADAKERMDSGSVASDEQLQAQATAVLQKCLQRTRQTASTDQFQTGLIEFTGNPLELAIAGEGFFRLIANTGEERFTRRGDLCVDEYGRMQLSNGMQLFPAIVVPPVCDIDRIWFDEDGTIKTQLLGEQNEVILGQIQLVRFPNPAGLTRQGNQIYAATTASGMPIHG
ncbi:MAG: flagellar hook basal-body protein, partial [Planctomycetaceae bacterium]|nr:flagellar hook basal-body protein [Planctomycetaceae bacterium]